MSLATYAKLSGARHGAGSPASRCFGADSMTAAEPPAPIRCCRRRSAALLALICALVVLAPVGSAGAAPAATLMEARAGRQGEDAAQLVLSLSRPVDYRLRLPPAADHIAVELPSVRLAPNLATMVTAQGLVARLRPVDDGAGGARLIAELKSPARVGSAYHMKAAERRDYQLVIILVPQRTMTPVMAAVPAAIPAQPAPMAVPSAAIAPQVGPPKPRPLAAAVAAGGGGASTGRPPPATGATVLAAVPAGGIRPRPRPSQGPDVAPVPPRRVVVVDAGHGGKDPGAISPRGTLEKTITLAFARELERQLRVHGGHKVVLTRHRDVFIPLRERVAIARGARADLFLSIHADMMPNPDVSGLSVYTLSDEASDAEAAALAERENRADRRGGIGLAGQTPEAASILIDVVQRHTMNRSIEMASLLVSELRHVTPVLPVKPHRFAGFAVLKAPDVPSVLIELGYLSNAADEQRLRDGDHRRRLAAAIAAAVDRYFGEMQVARLP